MKAWTDLKKLPQELWILCLATFVNRLGTMVLPFLVLYLTRSLGYSPARAGAVLAVYGAVALIVGPISGRLTDRWGALRLMEVTLVASGIILLIFPLAHSWTEILVMTVLFALTNESFRPANLTLVGELGPPELRKSAFALSRWVVNLGMSVGPALGGFLAQTSFTTLFIVDGLTTLAAAGILIFSSFHRRVKSRPLPVRKDAPKVRSWVKDLFYIDANIRFFLLACLTIALVFFQHQAAMPLFLVRDLHFSEVAYGILFTLNTILIITLEIPLNSATSHWTHRRTLALGSFLFALGFGALAVARTYTQVAFTVVIWTFGEMILFPGMSAYVSEIAPEGRRGEYMGLYMTAFSVAFMVGPWVGTLVLESFGAVPLWVGTLVVGLFSVGIFSYTRQNKKPAVFSGLSGSGLE